MILQTNGDPHDMVHKQGIIRDEDWRVKLEIEVWVDGSTAPPRVAYVTSNGDRTIFNVPHSWLRKNGVKVRANGNISTGWSALMECYAIDYALRSIKSRKLVVYCDSSSLVYVLCNGKEGRRRSANLVRSIRQSCADRDVWFRWINGRKNPADALLKIEKRIPSIETMTNFLPATLSQPTRMTNARTNMSTPKINVTLQ